MISSAHIALSDGLRRVSALAVVATAVAACGGGDGSATPTATPRTDGGSPSADRAARATSSPTVVADIPFPTNLTFDGRGGLWVSSGSRGKSASDGIWYVPRGGRPRHVAGGLTAALGLTWARQPALRVARHIRQKRPGDASSTASTARAFTRRSTAIDGIPVGAEHHGLDRARAGRAPVRQGRSGERQRGAGGTRPVLHARRS